jgi:hypothetical protein
MISLSVHVEFTVGFLRTAHIMALAIRSSGVTFTPAKSVEALSLFTYSIVLVASTSTKIETCGAVKADCTIAVAIAFLTPFTGMRSSRSDGIAGVVRFLKTEAWVAALTTSSRVISPAGPVAVTFERSTFRSFASFLIGGFAITSVESADGIAELPAGTAAATADAPKPERLRLVPA